MATDALIGMVCLMIFVRLVQQPGLIGATDVLVSLFSVSWAVSSCVLWVVSTCWLMFSAALA